jgi:hypothetical protein
VEIGGNLSNRWKHGGFEANEGAVLKCQRRGWFMGGKNFRKQLLEQMNGQLGERHSGGTGSGEGGSESRTDHRCRIETAGLAGAGSGESAEERSGQLALGNLLRQANDAVDQVDSRPAALGDVQGRKGQFASLAAMPPEIAKLLRATGWTSSSSESN